MRESATGFVTGNYNYESESMDGINGQLEWESQAKRRRYNIQ